VRGAIHEKWAALGWETSFLGYPTSDEEMDSHGGIGRVSRFQGGAIYWTPETDAHEVHGAILQRWTDLGAEQSYLGYPVTDEGSWIDAGRNEEVRISKFQHGEIDWTAKAGAAPWPTQYSFTLNRVRVLNTRSAHQDTDHVSLSVAVGNDPAQTVTHEIGDVNNGTYEVDLSIGPVSVRARDDGLAVNYIVLNAGHASWDEINKALHDIGRFLAEKGAAVATAAVGTAIGASVGSGVMPVIGTAIGAVAGFIVGEVVGVLTADCDGVVAVEQGAFKGQDLWELTVDGTHTFSTHHDGTDSPGGCGSNSIYEVDWSVSRAGA
jgi:uncharacterized protein with LGFP repeats